MVPGEGTVVVAEAGVADAGVEVVEARVLALGVTMIMMIDEIALAGIEIEVEAVEAGLEEGGVGGETTIMDLVEDAVVEEEASMIDMTIIKEGTTQALRGAGTVVVARLVLHLQRYIINLHPLRRLLLLRQMIV